MKTKKNLLLLLMLLVLPFTSQAETFNVKKYGARGNGKKMDSPAIQKAIDACHKAGGGTVLVPAGTYLSATIVLKDNVTLHLEKDVVITAFSATFTPFSTSVMRSSTTLT